ncbi:fibropellin-1-like [Haliotis asinina]|uniref:fibropellin-1-like n=1 Tax=Haliotis asinina TaxID=109174 RepID=UPI0035326EA5
MTLLRSVLLLATIGSVLSKEIPTTHVPDGQEHKDVDFYVIPFGDYDQVSDAVLPVEAEGISNVNHAVFEILEDYIDGTVDEEDHVQGSTPGDSTTRKTNADHRRLGKKPAPKPKGNSNRGTNKNNKKETTSQPSRKHDVSGSASEPPGKPRTAPPGAVNMMGVLNGRQKPKQTTDTHVRKTTKGNTANRPQQPSQGTGGRKPLPARKVTTQPDVNDSQPKTTKSGSKVTHRSDRTKEKVARKTNASDLNGTVAEDTTEKNDVPNCASHPCMNGARCLQNNDTFTCICSPGYAGVRCASDIRTCEDQPCLNDATCTDTTDSYSCSCRIGFTGRTCKTDIDECESNPCHHGATCVDGTGTYKCVCKQGFVGETCLQDVRHCDLNPCLHGGTCVDENGTYSCICSPGFTGSTCEADTRHCDKVPCMNGATCTDGIGDFHCACMKGFSGLYCESDIRSCRDQPCDQDTVCVDKDDTYTCICREGFTGPRCQTDIRTCEDHPCLNGTCVPRDETYSCTCITGFTGGTCETDINECESSPCHNGATCKDLVGTYNCVCKAGFSGPNCVEDKRNCDSQPCLHGSTCVDGNDTYTCICSPGFTGQTCEADTRHCDKHPCLNGATCTDGLGDFICACAEGFSGIYCESVCTPDKVDLLFMKDVSSTITTPYYNKMVAFMNGLLNELDIRPDGVNVALSVFSGRVKVDFHLNDYRYNKTGMLRTMNMQTWRGGKTYLALALEMAANEVFAESNGDRPDAKNVVIIYTDGRRTGTMDITAVVKDVQSKAEVMMVLTSDNVDMDTARRVVTPPVRTHLFHIDDKNLIDRLKKKISTVTCRGK